MDEGGKNVTEQVSWNLSQQIIMQIGNLMSTASSDYLKGDYPSCFHKFREIRVLIGNDVSKEELAKLKEVEERIISYIPYTNPTIKNKYHNKGNLINYVNRQNNDAVYVLFTYRELIIELLGKYGYHIAKKEETARMF